MEPSLVSEFSVSVTLHHYRETVATGKILVTNSAFSFSAQHPVLESRSLSARLASHSPSRKHLRYEAAELVRSLQSSRNSLDKVGLASNPGSYSSGGTLGRRLGRPYSPAMREKHLQLSPAPAGPTVESPVTPHNSSAPASLSHALNNLKLEQDLSIEEVDCSSASGSLSGHCSPDIQEALSAPASPDKELASPIFHSNQSTSLPRGTRQPFLLNSEYGDDKPERPNELNFNDPNKKQGYIFNCNWNFNKNKY